MKRLILIVSLISCLFALPVHAQEGTKTYTGQGITLDYPQSWFLFEKKDGVGLSSVALHDETDVTKVSSGVVTVRVLLLDSYEVVRLAETDSNFRLGYYASLYMQGYVWPELLNAQLSGVDIEGLELSVNVGEVETLFEGEKSALMIHETISFVNRAEFYVILIDDSIIVVASAPAGELEPWRETIIEVAESIETVAASG